MRKSWQVFHDRSLLGRCFRFFFKSVLEYCSAVWCSAADIHLKLLDRVVSSACFSTGGVLNLTLLIVDLWQYYVGCIRSSVIRCTLFMVLYLCRMCRCGLHKVLWSHLGILINMILLPTRPVEEQPTSTAYQSRDYSHSLREFLMAVAVL